MHSLSNLRLLLFLLACCCQTVLGVLRGRPDELIKPYKREVLQDLVTWDRHSIFVHGQRILFYSGEFHPFRLPVPGLWFDIFQKIRALGYTGVSFYTNWALLEGKQGDFSADGIFDLDPFFDGATRAGIYLLARPGPYINAEVSGGGFPGWLQRTTEVLRTPEYINYTNNYVQRISTLVAQAQITQGGPVILLQPENEYSQATNGTLFPNYEYFQEVEDKFREAGIVVPFISNDARPQGFDAPGNGTVGNVDIYGHDAYPQGFDCANPYVWIDGALPTNFHTLHLQQSPSTPYSLVEFQGGSFDPWGGPGFTKCEILTNEAFERVFYKNDFSFGVTLFNVYMTFGGTNWGNLGYALGYTSYDYGSVIAEDRTITREKYSEAKLEANFLLASPAYLTAIPGNASNGSYVNTNEIAVTRLVSNETSFYVVRHAAYNSNSSTCYRLSFPTSKGMLEVPQLTSALTLNGRDSKIHVTDYSVDGSLLLYSTAEIFTWKSYESRKVLVVYGGPGENHELAIVDAQNASIVEHGTSPSKQARNPSSVDLSSASGVEIQCSNQSLLINWNVSSSRTVLRIDRDFFVYLLDRNEAYSLWVLELAVNAPIGNFTDPRKSSVIVKAGYLLRTATIHGNTLALTGDLNRTTAVEIIGAPTSISSVTFNGKHLPTTLNSYGVLIGNAFFSDPTFSLPELVDANWKYQNSLPEIQVTYDDSHWPSADHPTSLNPRHLTTPRSLYGSDYGFSSGTLVFRGHFTASGLESTLFLQTQGGTAFGHSVWLNSTFLGAWPGLSMNDNYNQTLPLPKCAAGSPYVITVVIDTMGLEEENVVGSGTMKRPRGILRYNLDGHQNQSDIRWKITGNLGGEDYRDRIRGPLNEGGMYAERQGFHIPTPPIDTWEARNPITQGIDGPGIGFFSAVIELNLPSGYDIPLAFVFGNSSLNSSTAHSPQSSNMTQTPVNDTVVPYRVQLFVNGYQFGKYVHNIGPQKSFPVPEGILNHHGKNYIALTLWSLDRTSKYYPDNGQGQQQQHLQLRTRIESLKLVSTAVIQTGYGVVDMAPIGAWHMRDGAY